jgi:hypothetical protein
LIFSPYPQSHPTIGISLSITAFYTLGLAILKDRVKYFDKSTGVILF